jgi:hypothetical protein
MAFLALTLIHSGFAALSLAMDRHHRLAFGRLPHRYTAVTLRILGFALLAMTVPLCLRAWGSTAGLVAWFGLMTAAALLSVLMTTYFPRAAAGVALAAPAVAILAIV